MKLHPEDPDRLATEPKCPTCGSTLDAFTSVEKLSVHPKDGDYSICAYCAQPLEAKGEIWVKLEGDDLAEAMKDPWFRMSLSVINEVRKRRQT